MSASSTRDDTLLSLSPISPCFHMVCCYDNCDPLFQSALYRRSKHNPKICQGSPTQCNLLCVKKLTRKFPAFWSSSIALHFCWFGAWNTEIAAINIKAARRWRAFLYGDAAAKQVLLRHCGCAENINLGITRVGDVIKLTAKYGAKESGGVGACE